MPRAPLTVSVVGLGPMGLPIALSLRRAGFRVDAWNRSAGPADAFRGHGGTVVADPAQLQGQVVLSVLPDVDQLLPLMTGLSGRRDRTVVVMSTSGPSRVTELADTWSGGISFADAPMSGGVAAAETATLSIMVGATESTFLRVEPVLRGLGSTVEHVGPLGSGMLAKLCNQVIVGSTLAAVAEAVVLAEVGGINLDTLLRVLQGGLADSAVLRAKATRLAARDYVGGGSTRNQVKDLRYAVDAAVDLGSASVMAATALGLYEATVDAGLADADHSAVAEVVRALRDGH